MFGKQHSPRKDESARGKSRVAALLILPHGMAKGGVATAHKSAVAETGLAAIPVMR